MHFLPRSFHHLRHVSTRQVLQQCIYMRQSGLFLHAYIPWGKKIIIDIFETFVVQVDMFRHRHSMLQKSRPVFHLVVVEPDALSRKLLLRQESRLFLQWISVPRLKVWRNSRFLSNLRPNLSTSFNRNSLISLAVFIILDFTPLHKTFRGSQRNF